MVAHFCKSGVIRPGTFLSDICYTLQKLQRTLTHLFFPLSSIYTPFPEDSCMQIKISLFFPALFEGSQSDPTVWGVCWDSLFPVAQADFAAQMYFICMVTVRMCWSESGLVCGWLSHGVTKILRGAKSPQVSAHEAESGGDWGAVPYGHQFIPLSPGLHRTEKIPTWAGF